MIKTIATRFAAWLHERDVLRELSMMSTRELADIGLSRADIPFVAAGMPSADMEPIAAVAAFRATGVAPAGPVRATAPTPTSLAA